LPTIGDIKQQQQRNNMKNNNATVTATATAIANALWASYEANIALSEQIVTLLQATSRDIVKAGQAVGLAWNEIGGAVEDGLPTRLLVEACANTKLTKEETRAFIKATGLVSKQRAHVLTTAVYDGVSAEEAKGKGKGKGKDKDKGKGKVNPRLTAEQILEAMSKVTWTKKQIEEGVLKFQAMLA
jgi:hypothetical protein